MIALAETSFFLTLNAAVFVSQSLNNEYIVNGLRLCGLKGLVDLRGRRGGELDCLREA